MSREIKFRAYSKKFGVMVYPNDTKYSIRIGNGDIHSVWLDSIDDEGVPVMQYVGLKDKNGREIYEGDIIDEFIGIRWDSERASYEFYLTFNDESLLGEINWDEAPEYLSTIEVLGNIYENTELLK